MEQFIARYDEELYMVIQKKVTEAGKQFLNYEIDSEEMLNFILNLILKFVEE